MENRTKELLDFVKYNKVLHKMYNKLSELEINGKVDSSEYETIKDLLCETTTYADQLIVDHYNDPDFIFNIIYLLTAHTAINDEIETEKKSLNRQDVETYTYNDEEIVIEDDENDFNDDISNDDMYYYFKYAEYSLFKRFNEHSFEIIDEETRTNEDEDMTINSVVIGNEKYHLERDREILENKYGKDVCERLQNDFQEYQRNNSPFIRNYYITYLKYEALTFYAYLLDAINNQTNPIIKNILIKAKYNIISCVRPIEEAFLYDENIDDMLIYYGKILLDIFREDNSLYEEYVKKNQWIIEEFKAMISERNKDKYEDDEDIINDILKDIFMKTILSCTPNPEERKSLIKGLKQAKSVAKTDLDKQTLQKVMKIKENYTFQHEKYDR